MRIVQWAFGRLLSLAARMRRSSGYGTNKMNSVSRPMDGFGENGAHLRIWGGGIHASYSWIPPIIARPTTVHAARPRSRDQPKPDAFHFSDEIKLAMVFAIVWSVVE